MKDYRFLAMSILLFLSGGYVVTNSKRVKAMNQAVNHFSGRWPTWMTVAFGITLLLFGVLMMYLFFVPPYRP